MNRTFVALSILLFSAYSFATPALDSYCFTQPGKSDIIIGKDLSQMLPLASVSKVLTSHWALAKLGPQFRYKTVLHLIPVDRNTWDLHLSGSRDPLFGKENLHFIISELNKLGITNIRNFTFDEKMKIFWNVRRSDVGEFSHYSPISPAPMTVLQNIRSKSPFLVGYASTRNELAQAGVLLVEKPQFTIQNIAYVSSRQFARENGLRVSITKTFYSAPLVELLKEMNRTSNNHAANQIFESLGGQNEYSKFIHQVFTLANQQTVRRSETISDDQIKIVNGSGSPRVLPGKFDYYLENGEKVYNRASCKAMMTILTHLYWIAKLRQINFDEIFAVPGDNTYNTLNNAYGGDLARVLMAKTGTVDTNITLAGLASTQSGPVLFYYNMAIPEGGPRDIAVNQTLARQQIRARVTQLIQNQFGGGQPIRISTYGATSLRMATGKITAGPPPIMQVLPFAKTLPSSLWGQ